jgi:hypothetical protein
MDLSRIKQLREELDDECIGLSELSEIEEAFKQVPDNELSDLRENAMASDMLDVLEERVTPIELSIYNWVAEAFGENEANDPSWNIALLAKHLNKEFKLK